MTCRFELEFKVEEYPRTCPTCGLSGKCHKGYEQIRKEKGGYELVNDAGVNRKGLRIGMDGLAYIPHHSVVPERTGYTSDPPSVAEKQAANPKAVATGDLGLPSGDKLRGDVPRHPILIAKRLKLIGYLADNFDQRGAYTVHDLDRMVDKIAAILLDD